MGCDKANRVQSLQTKILHRKSGIECALQFDTQSAFRQSEEATQIILDYMKVHPMCKSIFILRFTYINHEIPYKQVKN